MNSIYALTICGGISLIVATLGVFSLAIYRETVGRPFLPWGARVRVEREKAHTEVLGEHLKQDATEIKRLALEHQRERVLAAIAAGESEQVMALGLPSAEPARTNGYGGEWR